MLHDSLKILLFTLLTILLSGCLNEDSQPQPEQSVKGRIVLSLVGMEGYVDAQTRSTALTNYDGYTYTLTGTSLIDGHSISESGTLASLMNASSLELEAASYRLTVSNESATQTGVGFPTYSGFQDFTLHVDDNVNVSINMGSPSNTKLTIVLDGTFSGKYTGATLTASGRTINLTSASTVAYFPVGTGTVSYTVSAAAKSGSHVTDINGVAGSINDVEAGTAYTLTLKADAVSGELIPIVSGTHTGEFD